MIALFTEQCIATTTALFGSAPVALLPVAERIAQRIAAMDCGVELAPMDAEMIEELNTRYLARPAGAMCTPARDAQLTGGL
jgi:hypothetical protein